MKRAGSDCPSCQVLCWTVAQYALSGATAQMMVYQVSNQRNEHVTEREFILGPERTFALVPLHCAHDWDDDLMCAGIARVQVRIEPRVALGFVKGSCVSEFDHGVHRLTTPRNAGTSSRLLPYHPASERRSQPLCSC